MLDLRSVGQKELIEQVMEAGFAPYRGNQVFQWIQQKGAVSFTAMSNLPKDIINWLEANFVLATPEILQENLSAKRDTVKLLLQWQDGNTTEMVIMLYTRNKAKDRQTCCISTQVGCGMGCVFCATALDGFKRNLTAGEIVAQVQLADAWCRRHQFTGISNVVYMGMGEPLANMPAVLKSIGLLNNSQGMNIGQRRITVSTCGLVPQIYKLAEEELAINLAVSLHAAKDEVRNILMPVNAAYPIVDLLQACRHYAKVTGRRITYEYALFEGVNDRKEDAAALGHLLKGTLSHVNLIPANLVPGSGFLPSGKEKVAEFAKVLENHGVPVSVRESRGGDILAACGQLRQEYHAQKQEKQESADPIQHDSE